MRELDVIRAWVELVQKMNQWPHFGDWNNHQFQLLSDEISDKSGIKIDRNTIRKIVESVNNGKPYSPHLSTKDALARYIGNTNWQQFTKSLKNPEKQNRSILWFIISVISVLIIFSVLYVIKSHERIARIEFSVENPEGVIPHTVICNYNIEEIKTDDIFLDYGHVNPDGNYILHNINKNSNINTHCFHYPGTYNIRLLADGEVKATEKVWINSRGWFVYAIDAASYISKHEVPEVLKKAGLPPLQHIPFNAILKFQTIDDSYFYIPEEQINAIEGLPTNHHLHLKNFKPFGVDMQNAQFSIRFKDDDFGEGINCSEVAIYLYCENGNVGFKFAQQGCERYTHQRIGGSFKAGKDYNLNHLILDYKQFRTISIKGKPDEVILLLDGNEIGVFHKQQELGEIRGLHFWFKGSPYIDFVRIMDDKDNVIFAEEFD